ncbi:hypothetical protein [Ruegeria sp. YS9]|uniref:hypothetical protein n=1 Tax=Ruegeria sp. YS9 TaxID=2966453 RepID=UPI00214C0945|nr:hypothetical protein [Ruegeria sp. YS9]UUV08715.1 hypothetical protein NOR97_20790 [Ruegeria sp. YS9]
MQEEITVTVQLVYSCSADNSLTSQGHSIHDDLLRLLDADSTTGVECCGFTIQHLSPEALTYGNAEARQGAVRQSDRIKTALENLYIDTEEPRELLTYALCDLRHFADQHGLAFGRHDKDAHQYYRAERNSTDGEGQ